MIYCDDFPGQGIWLNKCYFRHIEARCRLSESSEADSSKAFDAFICDKYKGGNNFKQLEQSAHHTLALESRPVVAHAGNWSFIFSKDWIVTIVATRDVNVSGVCPYCKSKVLSYGSNDLNAWSVRNELPSWFSNRIQFILPSSFCRWYFKHKPP